MEVVIQKIKMELNAVCFGTCFKYGDNYYLSISMDDNENVLCFNLRTNILQRFHKNTTVVTLCSKIIIED